MGDEHPDTLTEMANLAYIRAAQGELESARHLQERVLETHRRILGTEHPSTVTSMNSLALTLHKQGKLTAALRMQMEVLEFRRRVLGEEHPATRAAAEALGLMEGHAVLRHLASSAANLRPSLWNLFISGP